MKRTAMMLGLATALLSTGCTAAYKDRMAETALQGRHARFDEKGHVYQVYEYYPEHQVYRSVYGGTWHWRRADNVWFRSAALPEGINVTGSSYELIELPTSQPSELHKVVVADHPSLGSLRAHAGALQDEHYHGTELGPDHAAYVSVPTDR